MTDAGGLGLVLAAFSDLAIANYGLVLSHAACQARDYWEADNGLSVDRRWPFNGVALVLTTHTWPTREGHWALAKSALGD
jgi:predicted GNAT superfamily acetyltransferase